MTSKDRKEIRYKHRQTKRRENKQKRSDRLGGVQSVFAYHTLFYYGKKCCNGIRWKQSTQNFELHLFSKTAKCRKSLLCKTWRPGKTIRFTLTERGKTREVDAPHITDRQVQKVLTKEVLHPLYTPQTIYDNGASQQGKGLHFAYYRLKEHLHRHYKKHKRTGVILLMDFKNFFPSAPHKEIYKRHQDLIKNQDLRNIADTITAIIPGDLGMPLGVETSQKEMIALPSSIDNHIKAQLQIKATAHYMDDYYMILESREEAKRIAKEVIAKAEAMGLKVNRKKCHIINLDKPFRFCKAKFYLTETGAVKIHGSRDGMKRARRKLKAFKKKVDAGEMTEKEVAEWLKSQTAYYKKFNDHGRVLKLNRIFYALFKKEEKECTK